MFRRLTTRRISNPPALIPIVAALALLSVNVRAQWLNFPTPGTPRTRDGKPNLSAPAPRTVEGKPDLSGVWMHEVTTVEDMRRLYGAIIEEAIKVDVPGMEIGTQHKYAVNILVEGAIITAVIQGDPDAADVARDAALKLLAEEKAV